MINIIGNIILSATAFAAQAAGIITSGLRLWLPFERVQLVNSKELVEGDNSTFDTSYGNWQQFRGAISWDSSIKAAKWTDNGTTGGPVGFTMSGGVIPLSIYKNYVIKFIAKTNSPSSFNFDYVGVGTNFNAISNPDLTSDFQEYKFIFSSNASSPRLYIGFGSTSPIESGNSYWIDNVSIKEVNQFAPDISGVTNEELGEDVIIDGTFPNSNNWTEDSEWTISGGLLNKDGSTDNNTRQLISNPIGKSYQITYTISNYVKGGFKPTFGYTDLTTRNANGTYTEVGTFTATSGTFREYLRLYSVGDSEYSITNVILKEVTQPYAEPNNALLVSGMATQFDGVNDMINFRNIGVGVKTLAFWLKSDSLTESVLELTSTQSISVSSGTITLSGTWTGSNIYVDGVSSSTIPLRAWKRVVVTTTSAITANAFALGKVGTSYGQILLSDLQFYDVVWTQDDVTYDYNNPNHLVTDNDSTSIALSNLKGYWAMTEGSGTLITDSSSERNDGPLKGIIWRGRQETILQKGMVDWSKGNNLIPYSELFTWGTWLRQSGGTGSNPAVNINYATAPDGTQTATRLILNLNSGTSSSDFSQLATNLGNLTGDYTNSIFVKSNTSDNYTITLTKPSGGSEAKSVTQDWQRIDATNLGLSNQSVSLRVRLKGDESTSDYVNILIWGAQTEESSSVGPYRRTIGATASNSIIVSDPNNPSKDVLTNTVRLREHSFNLDGISYAEVADDASINPTDAITVECWVYWTNTSSDKGIVAKLTSGTNKDYALYQATTTKFDFYIGATNLRCTTALSNGWNHIAGTYDKTNMKVYVNGDLDGTLSNTSAIPNTTQVLEIGRYNNSESKSYSERIDDVRIYDRALSADEILNNFTVGLPEHQAGSDFSDDFSGDYGN